MFAHVQSLLGMDKILYHGDSLGRVMSDEKSEMRADTRDQAYWLSVSPCRTQTNTSCIPTTGILLVLQKYFENTFT